MIERDYYSIDDRVSNSFLTQFKRAINNETSAYNAEALHFGSGLHCLLLEPHNFNTLDYSGRDRMKMMYMVNSIQQCADPKHLEGEKEKEFMYSFKGLNCKLKADIVNSKYVVDVKTTAATSLESFMEQAIKYDYHRQAAWYIDCPEITADTFVFIAVCKSSPYQVFTWEISSSDPFIEAGRDDYNYLLSQLKKDPALLSRFKAEGEYHEAANTVNLINSIFEPFNTILDGKS